MKRALCIGGGGAKGQFAIGALKYLLLEQKIQYDILTGVSVGALITAFLAQYRWGEEEHAYNDLEKLFSPIENKDIWKSWLPLFYAEGLWKSSVLNSKPLIDMIKNNLDLDKIARANRTLRIGTTSLTTGNYKIFTESSPNLHACVYASAAFPVAFIPGNIDGELFTDGGVKSVTPLRAAIEAGADIIDAIILSPPGALEDFDPKPNAIQVGMRAIDLMSSQIVEDDIIKCRLYNKLVSAGLPDGKRAITLNVIRPETQLVNNSLNFDPGEAQRLQGQGYVDCLKVMNNDA